MYDIRQFRPTLYLVLFLGLSGFAMAAELPEIWLLSMLGLGIHIWLVKTGRFVPLPRWLANLITLLALAYVIARIYTALGTTLMAVGQFLVLLQLIKLYEQRANRDVAQLLILSLLLMVAAAINATNLAFGIVLVVYLLISLYCCLIFHLKVEADRAKAAFAIPEDKISPSTLRQDQRFLTRSMRRLTALVAVISLVLAVVVFLFFPRGPGHGVLGQLQLRVGGALTGFSDRVGFDQINDIKQNDQVVAHVTVWRNGQLVEGQPLHFRGLTLDVYGAESRAIQRPQWTRSQPRNEECLLNDQMPGRGPLRPAGDIWRQKVALRPNGTSYLFALQGLMFQSTDAGLLPAIRPDRMMGVRYSLADDSLQASEAINVPIEYEIYSTNSPHPPDPFEKLLNQTLMPVTESDPRVLDQIRDYVLRTNCTDGLAEQRPRLAYIHEMNEPVARKIEQHLRTNFAYTLNLTDSRHLFEDSDPVVAFLNTVRKGHCEYFASAMTLMCQSLGIPARMVVGFRCDDYNVIGHYYIVRQSHAHTWVEVLTPRGWVAFDPTSGQEAVSVRAGSWWQSVKHFLDFLEYKWGESVIAYDTRNQDEVWRSADSALVNFLITSGEFTRKLFSFKRDNPLAFWRASFDILAGLIALMIAAIVVIVVWYLLQQRRLRRRAARIGFDTLPVSDQIRLARQLAFYDQLTRALHRHRIVRPPHLTPLEFAHSLVFLPGGVYEAIRRLTGILYRVRFGQAELNSVRQRRLQTVVARLAHALDAYPPAHRSSGPTP